MSDSNPTRVRYAQHKAAFDEVIGDPFATEPIEGAYYRMKRRSSLRVANIDDGGHATSNPARPNAMDFFCDVERAVKEVILPEVLDTFWRTYLNDEPLLRQEQRNVIEQALGRKFRARKISPVSRYFISIRRPIGPTKAVAPLRNTQ